MSNILKSSILKIVAKVTARGSGNSNFYKEFHPAPSYWALVPVRKELDKQSPSREEMVSQIINKNKHL